MKLSVIIPVFNEQDTLSNVVQQVVNSEVNCDLEIIIVDDASSDRTPEIIKEINRSYPQIKSYCHVRNAGKSAALKTGFKQATGDYIIIQDADLEYLPDEYSRLIDLLDLPDTDVVYGSRFMNQNPDMPRAFRFGNKALTRLTNLLFGTKLTDMETCYKLFPRTALDKFEIKSNGFDFEPEVTAKLIKHGYKIKEVPISYDRRDYSKGKKITFIDGFIAVWALFKYRFFD